ncbi:MAG: hypothetical protein P4L31_01485 [Candidatus Babeliales bacterium]|nr:hypothetical protein [Candidatus Babeliales bacterium]
MNIKLLTACILITIARVDASATPLSSSYLITGHQNRSLQTKNVVSHATSSQPSPLEKKANAIIAQGLVGVLVAAENTALGPVAKLPVIKALEKKEVSFLVTELTKAEEDIENTLLQDMSKLCASWGLSCPAGWCLLDNARQD